MSQQWRPLVTPRRRRRRSGQRYVAFGLPPISSSGLRFTKGHVAPNHRAQRSRLAAVLMQVVVADTLFQAIRHVFIGAECPS
jgi:hypothetical protein